MRAVGRGHMTSVTPGYTITIITTASIWSMKMMHAITTHCVIGIWETWWPWPLTLTC